MSRRTFLLQTSALGAASLLGDEPRFEIGLRSLHYDRWQQAIPKDTSRFCALRLHEAGMITSTPRNLMAQGSDWRFLSKLKKELKA